MSNNSGPSDGELLRLLTQAMQNSNGNVLQLLTTSVRNDAELLRMLTAPDDDEDDDLARLMAEGSPPPPPTPPPQLPSMDDPSEENLQALLAFMRGEELPPVQPAQPVQATQPPVQEPLPEAALRGAGADFVDDGFDAGADADDADDDDDDDDAAVDDLMNQVSDALAGQWNVSVDVDDPNTALLEATASLDQLSTVLRLEGDDLNRLAESVATTMISRFMHRLITGTAVGRSASAGQGVFLLSGETSEGTIATDDRFEQQSNVVLTVPPGGLIAVREQLRAMLKPKLKALVMALVAVYRERDHVLVLTTSRVVKIRLFASIPRGLGGASRRATVGRSLANAPTHAVKRLMEASASSKGAFRVPPTTDNRCFWWAAAMMCPEMIYANAVFAERCLTRTMSHLSSDQEECAKSHYVRDCDIIRRAHGLRETVSWCLDAGKELTPDFRFEMEANTLRLQESLLPASVLTKFERCVADIEPDLRDVFQLAVSTLQPVLCFDVEDNYRLLTDFCVFFWELEAVLPPIAASAPVMPDMSDMWQRFVHQRQNVTPQRLARFPDGSMYRHISARPTGELPPSAGFPWAEGVSIRSLARWRVCGDQISRRRLDDHRDEIPHHNLVFWRSLQHFGSVKSVGSLSRLLKHWPQDAESGGWRVAFRTGWCHCTACGTQLALQNRDSHPCSKRRCARCEQRFSSTALFRIHQEQVKDQLMVGDTFLCPGGKGCKAWFAHRAVIPKCCWERHQVVCAHASRSTGEQQQQQQQQPRVQQELAFTRTIARKHRSSVKANRFDNHWLVAYDLETVRRSSGASGDEQIVSCICWSRVPLPAVGEQMHSRSRKLFPLPEEVDSQDIDSFVAIRMFDPQYQVHHARDLESFFNWCANVDNVPISVQRLVMVAHNGAGFDTVLVRAFLLLHGHRHNCTIQADAGSGLKCNFLGVNMKRTCYTTGQEAKLSFSFIDSRSFIQGPLSKFPLALQLEAYEPLFDTPEERVRVDLLSNSKDLFPYGYATEDKLDYCGNLPPRHYWNNDVTDEDWQKLCSVFVNPVDEAFARTEDDVRAEIDATPHFASHAAALKYHYQTGNKILWDYANYERFYCEKDVRLLAAGLCKFNLKFLCDLGFVPMFEAVTAASLALHTWQSCFLTRIPALNRAEDTLIREAYLGGRTEAFTTLLDTREHGGELFNVDVNSLYPSSYSLDNLPSQAPVFYSSDAAFVRENKAQLQLSGLAMEARSLRQRFVCNSKDILPWESRPIGWKTREGVVWIRYTTAKRAELGDSFIPPIGHKHPETGQLIFGLSPDHEQTASITLAELRLIDAINADRMRKGLCLAYNYTPFALADMGDGTKRLFEDFFGYFFASKLHASEPPSNADEEKELVEYIEELGQEPDIERLRAPKNEIARLTSKISLNSLYGKFAERTQATTRYFKDSQELEEWLVDSVIAPSQATQNIQPVWLADICRVGDQWRLKFLDESCSRVRDRTNVGVAAYITARARLRLYAMFEAAQRAGMQVVYCDTDSATLWAPPALLSSRPELNSLSNMERLKALIGPCPPDFHTPAIWPDIGNNRAGRWEDEYKPHQKLLAHVGLAPKTYAQLTLHSKHGPDGQVGAKVRSKGFSVGRGKHFLVRFELDGGGRLLKDDSGKPVCAHKEAISGEEEWFQAYCRMAKDRRENRENPLAILEEQDFSVRPSLDTLSLYSKATVKATQCSLDEAKRLEAELLHLPLPPMDLPACEVVDLFEQAIGDSSAAQATAHEDGNEGPDRLDWEFLASELEMDAIMREYEASNPAKRSKKHKPDGMQLIDPNGGDAWDALQELLDEPGGMMMGETEATEAQEQQGDGILDAADFLDMFADE